DWPAAVLDDEIPLYVPPPPIDGIDEQPTPPTLEDRRNLQADRLRWSLSDLLSNERLQPQQLTILKRLLAPNAAALTAARRLAEQPRGRFPLHRQAPAVRSACSLDRKEIRQVLDLLRLHALHLADTDVDGAFSKVVPLLNCSQLASDEPN